MKQKTLITLLYLMLLQSVLIVPAHAAVSSEGWKALRTNLYINEKTLTRLDGNIVSVWTYLVPRKGSDTYNAAREQLKSMKKNSRDLEYIGHLSEINCEKSVYRKITTVFFRNDRNIIASLHRAQGDWKEIAGSTVYPDVYQAVCGKDRSALRAEAEKD